MELYQDVFDELDHYDEGIVVDYATMVKMWSTLDRSLTTFNRNCGVITLRPSRDVANLGSAAEKVLDV